MKSPLFMEFITTEGSIHSIGKESIRAVSSISDDSLCTYILYEEPIGQYRTIITKSDTEKVREWWHN